MASKMILAAATLATVAAHGDHFHAEGANATVAARTCGTDHDEMEIMASTSIAETTVKRVCAHPELSHLRVCKSAEERRRMRPVEIPVWYHVVHAGTRGRLTEREIQAQFDQTNLDFAGREPGQGNPAVMDITFRLAGTTYTDNSLWFNDMERYETQVKNAVAVDNRYNFNQYFGDFRGGGLLGFCYFPNSFAESSNMHGCINLWSSIPGGASAPYNQGKTTTHETGHGIGLFHTFQGGCNGQGDQVADTCNQASPTNGCPTGRNSCSSNGCRDNIHNYMDYSTDACMNEFTEGQNERANRQLFTFRPSLYNSEQEMEDIMRVMPDAFAEARAFGEYSEAKNMRKRQAKGYLN